MTEDPATEDPATEDRDTATALFQAIHVNNVWGVRQLVGAAPQLLTATSPTGLSPVLFATYYHRPEITRVLIDAGAPLSVFEAAATGEFAALRSHLDARPTVVNAVSHDGFSPLGLAALFGREELAALLLARGAQVGAVSQNAMRATPLHSAVAGNHPRLTRMLLEGGAGANATQHGGFTPLMAAAQNGNADLVTLLLSHGAHAGATTDDGRTAADLAREEGHATVLGLLTPLPAPGSVREGHPQGNGKAIVAGRGETGAMSDERRTDVPDPNVIGPETDGRTGARTGFDTPDPKDPHQVVYTTTPLEDRVGSADHGVEGVVPQPPAAKEVTAQFDHLATRDVTAMELAPEDAEFAGAQTVAGLGGENLDLVVPSAGLGVNAGLATSVESRMRDADPNPGYIPPSQEVRPHVSERPGDLPPGESAELQNEIDGGDNRR